MRLAPTRFCIMADHFRSATVSRAAAVMSSPSIRIRMLEMETPTYVGPSRQRYSWPVALLKIQFAQTPNQPATQ